MVDNFIVRPNSNDFLLVSHDQIKDTTRPTYYWMLKNENSFLETTSHAHIPIFLYLYVSVRVYGCSSSIVSTRLL